MMWDGLIVFLGTHDLLATHEFYSGLLGLPLYKDQGLCRIYTVPGGGKLGFCKHMDNVAKGNSPYITLLTDEVDAMYDRLLAAGIEVRISPKKNERFNIYHFFINDPNGYTVEIQKFLE
jgi:catechol 2,3-dioxygenase-like lactoylglutathione lyase family enzyme